jgi:glycosyltransferase involved in cell wall biosynthesis
MIRVLHTIDTTGPGGAETIFINLVKGLDPNRFKSFAAIRGPGWVCDSLRKHQIQPIFIYNRGAFSFKYLHEMIRIIKKYEINVIQAHLFGSNLYCSMAGMITKRPVISTFHGYVDASSREKMLPLKKYIINRGSRYIVFVSNHLKRYYIDKLGFAEEKSVTIYNGVETSIFFQKKDNSIRKELGIEDEHILIGAVGNIRPAKNYDLFLKAAKLIHNQNKNTRFLIAGQGSGKLYNEIIKLRKYLGLEDVFFLLGFKEDIATLLNNLNVFILTSSTEGFSISTVEALACGLPIVVTKSGGPEEIVEIHGNGMIAEINEIDISSKVLKILQDLKENKRYDNEITSADKFSLQNMVNSYQALIG